MWFCFSWIQSFTALRTEGLARPHLQELSRSIGNQMLNKKTVCRDATRTAVVRRNTCFVPLLKGSCPGLKALVLGMLVNY